MRELYAGVSQRFSFGKLAKILKRNSRKLRTVVAAMAMIFIAAPFYGQTWNLVDLADLTSTDVFMIVDTASGYAMTNDNGTSSAPACVSLSFNADNSQVTTATIPDNVKWNISGDGTDGYTFYPNGATETWLYCSTTNNSGSNNNIRVGTGNRKLFLLSDAEHPYLMTNDDYVTRYVGVYSNQDTQDWRGYTSSTSNIASTRIAFYKYTANLNTVATPTFSPEAGTYNGTQNITIACATDGATIRYTLDGNDPTETSTEYTTAIEVSANTTIKAKAWKDGLTASGIATAEYVITNYTQLDAPTFSPVAGNYTGAQNITITAADGATIRYTLDGTDPTETSTEYTAAIRISSDKTIKAKAWMDGYLPSDVVSADYVIELPTVTFNKLASHTQITTSDVYMIVDVASGRALTSANGTNSAPTAVEVTIENNAITAAVPYELQWKFAEEEGGYRVYPVEDNEKWLYSTGSNDGVRIGTNDNKVWEIDITSDAQPNYHGMKHVATSRYLGVYNNANWRTYTSIHDNIANTQIEFFILGEAPEPAPANPTFNPAEGTFFNNVDVALACETEGATIYYTLDDTDPTDASTEYTEAIHITETTTVKAIAIKNALSSEIVSATYTISNIETVATPVITPEAGSYNTPQQITIVCETAEAVIHYTTDGTDPTAESTSYTEPFTLSASATVKAIAVKEGMNNSQIASAAYTMPVFLGNLAAVYSTENNAQYRVLGDVTFVFRSGRYMFVKDSTAGMMIYDNNTPIITGTYENGDVISGGISGKTSIYNGLYEIVPTADLAASTENAGAVEPVVVTIPQMSNGNDFMSQFVTVQNLTVTEISGQNIIVTDGENTIKIFDRFNVITESNYAANDVIISVTGFVSKYNSDYQIFPRTEEDIVKQEAPASPVFTPAEGSYTASVTVTLTCETEGATIYYNIEPNDAQLEYTEPLTFNDTTTINAFAEKDGLRSTVVTATYNITDREIVATPTITPNGGEFETSVEVTLACETEGSAIYYTTDGNTPTVAEENLYSEPFTLYETSTVKAIAVKDGMENSAVAEATFTKQPSALTFTKIASHDLITTDDIYMIVDVNSKKALTSENGSGSAPTAVDVTIENDTITGNIPNVLMWKFAEVEGGYSIYPVDNNEVWLYSTNSNNGVRVGTNANKAWLLDITADTVPTYHGMKNYATSRYLGVYSEQDWRTYTSIHDNIRDTQIEFFVLGNAASVVATPTFSVPAGIYTTAQTVEILCATEGATIRYTLDGTDPTEESTEYTTEALTITAPTTVKAKAFKQDCIASGVAEAFYNVNTTPTITVDAETLNFENVNETKTVNVLSFNLTSDITVAVSENFTVDAESITMNTDATLTVTFTGDVTTTGTLTLTSGETIKTVALVATIPVASEGCYYPIAEALTDWTGEYLITYTDLSAETINVLKGIHNSNYGTYENIFQYYEDGIIESNLTTEMCKVTVAPTEDGKYSMYLNGNGYLGLNSDGNKLYAYETFTETRDEWTFSENNGEIVITSVKYTNRNLKWNSGDPRFACYKNTSTTGDPLTLYKLGAIPTVATPVFTPVAGYYTESQNVTITCATEGATIYYTTDGTTPTNESTQYTEAIAVSQNTTIKAIAYLGEEVSFMATARYTFPNFVENIAALYALENTTDTYVLTGDVTFVYRNGSNMYVKDATAGLLIYDRSNIITTEYTEGDVISGGITGTITMYYGMLEFVPTFNTAASTQNTGAVAPTVITVEQLRTNDYVSQLVKVENVAVATGTTYTEGHTGRNVTFSQNGNEAVLRNGFKTLDMEIGDNTNWDITGFAVFYSDTIQIYPRSNEDVSIVTSVDELASEIAIYPNPTSDIVNIVTDGNAQRVEIANVDGQVVSNEAVASDVVTISLEAQPAGMYFVRIYTANEVIVRKVTKF